MIFVYLFAKLFFILVYLGKVMRKDSDFISTFLANRIIVAIFAQNFK